VADGGLVSKTARSELHQPQEATISAIAIDTSVAAIVTSADGQTERKECHCDDCRFHPPHAQTQPHP
jgi:hypothetical protein